MRPPAPKAGALARLSYAPTPFPLLRHTQVCKIQRTLGSTLAGAFAYYQYQYDPNTDPQAQNGQLIYTPGNVQPKHLINAENFKWGYPTADESWVNYWRKGPNVNIGWDQSLTGSGTGASSLGQELANTDTFASCQVKKVFQTVCLRSPVDQNDRNQVDAMATTFKSGYNLKQAFSEAASYCLIPTP